MADVGELADSLDCMDAMNSMNFVGSCMLSSHPQLTAMMTSAVGKLVAIKEGKRRVSELFLQQPDRTLYPDYYRVIQHPISFADIQAHIAAREYVSLDALADDLALLVRNAQTYNEVGSQVPPPSMLYCIGG